jgi:hypothetical protein
LETRQLVVELTERIAFNHGEEARH